MKRPSHPIDRTAPLASLGAVTGLSGVQLAEALGMSKQALYSAQRRGSGIRMCTFDELADRLGYEVETRIRKK